VRVAVWISLLFLGAAPMSAALPDAYQISYEMTAGMGDPKDAKTRISITYGSGHARLEITYPAASKQPRVTRDPFAQKEAEAVWAEIQAAHLDSFKPQPGPAVPDFGTVRLSAEWVENHHTVKGGPHEWGSPLKNDGQIWNLTNHLGQILLKESERPRPSPSPIHTDPPKN
jgi:hypothetical protein